MPAAPLKWWQRTTQGGAGLVCYADQAYCSGFPGGHYHPLHGRLVPGSGHAAPQVSMLRIDQISGWLRPILLPLLHNSAPLKCGNDEQLHQTMCFDYHVACVQICTQVCNDSMQLCDQVIPIGVVDQDSMSAINCQDCCGCTSLCHKVLLVDCSPVLTSWH